MAVLVTGASRGIGRAVFLELAKRGFDVAGICLKNEERLKAAVEEAASYNVMALGISGVDVGDFYSLEEKVYKNLKAQGIQINVVINNAGIAYVGLIQDMPLEEWGRIINTNLTSMYNTTKLFLPDMLKRKSGKIINISSVWGNVGASMEAAYSAAKGGVNSFTKALARETAPSGIQVNAVAFGAIDTEMNNSLSEEEKAALAEEIPMGRMGREDEAAALIAGLLDMPGYLTGQIITMDGGWT